MKIDHLVVNIAEKYQNDNSTIESIRKNKFPYEPKWGKGNKGFKVSNLWIGNEYLEMVRILKENGGGWINDWRKKYNQGHRGMICLMIDVQNIDSVYQSLKDKEIDITVPEWLEFKWCFNMLTRRMPWRNCYVPFFDNVPFQIGFQEMKDEKSRDFMNQYMVPNSKDNGINGIYHIIIKGQYSDNDFKMIRAIFNEVEIKEEKYIVANLNESQSIKFEKNDVYQIELFTNSNEDKFIEIENLIIHY